MHLGYIHIPFEAASIKNYNIHLSCKGNYTFDIWIITSKLLLSRFCAYFISKFMF